MWTQKMDLLRKKRRKHCTAAEEHGISAHVDTSAIFFLGNKGSALPDAPYLGKLSIIIFTKHRRERGNHFSVQCGIW